MKYRILSLGLAIAFLSSCKDDEEVKDDNTGGGIPVPAGYTLEWSDEFDGQSIDPTIWTFETGDGTAYGLPPGWGNEEKQIYTNSSDNAYLSLEEGNEVLAITALKTGAEDYTSAKLTTEGLKSIRFGRVDIRAKVPAGNGLWPALWMLGENRPIIDWPGCGEIDIMEVLGKEPNKMYTTLHYVATDNKKGELQKEHPLASGNYSDNFHVYSMEWTPTKIQYLLDQTPVYEETIEGDMKEFLRPFYVILNLAVGGYWPGDPDPTTNFPATMYVDYVRYYSINNLNIPSAPPLDTNEERLGPIIDNNLANAAIRDGFTSFGAVSITPYGSGGEPALRRSDTAVDGDFSLVYDFPGGSWGGAYIEKDTPSDLSTFSTLKFSLRKPSSLDNAEIKLEGVGNSAIVMLKDYTGTPISNGFEEYSIPLSDFVGLDLTEVRIPFAMWNAVDAAQNFSPATVYVDDVYFE